MASDFREERGLGESAAERRRSRSGAADSRAPESECSEGMPEGVVDGSEQVPDGGDVETPIARSQAQSEFSPEDYSPPESVRSEPPLAALESVPRLSARKKGRRLKKPQLPRSPLTPEQRLLLLDTWRRSGLPASDFASLVGVSKHTLYAWKKRFETRGPEGLVDQKKGGPRGSRLSEVTRRAILMLKEANPDWGTQRISDMLLRGPALPASPSAVARVLHEAGYEFEEVTSRAHGQKPKRFERAKSNELWQTDLFTFTLKRQNRRVYLVAFLDDHSRFIVGYGLHATQSSALVMEVLRAAVVNFRSPKEILTDNGSQYVTWRGKSAFSKELQKRGIQHVVATPRRPQTLGKIERFWGSLWRECLEAAVFADLDDARKRIGHYIDHYNFQRPHQGIAGLTPADRYFEAAPEVLRTLKERIEANALDLAREGPPRAPFYLTGNAGGKPFSVHAEGERIFLSRPGADRQEIDLEPEAQSASSQQSEQLPEPLAPGGEPADRDRCEDSDAPPGTSPLDSSEDIESRGGEA